MNLTFRDLEYFLTLAAVGHMGRAAEMHGVTQPALSRSLSRLEAETGLTLFDRATRRIVLNAAGLAFLEHAQRLHAHYQETIQHTSALQAGQAGLLRIGATGATLDTLVAPALASLQPRRPAMRATLTVGLSDDLLERLTHGDLDLAVVPIYGQYTASLNCRVLLRDQLVIIVRRTHALAGCGTLKPEQLLAYPWVLPLPSAWIRDQLSQYFAARGLPDPKAALELPFLSTGTLNAIATTDLVILAPDSIVDGPLREHFTVLPIDFKLERQICVLTRQNCRWTPLMQELDEALSATHPP
ncbi:LysR family transcriptional regulator [Pusillimonas sp. TS35]|uniref:LysR family transcriptional regulator n=1 Tax=Paracandidimonas lactea TaxID=2895524 RepID=UPI001368EB00|nr:LysR family transcriptional regulator [Paracandidimonas lactea]MYN13334.1 LysR family transcriptional regulator [Pusillimonas sp. TS35]